MELKRPVSAPLQILLVVVLVIAIAVPVGFAYMAYTENSGINVGGSELSVYVYDGHNLDPVEIPGSEREYYKTGSSFQVKVGNELRDCDPITGYYYKKVVGDNVYRYSKISNGVYKAIGDSPDLTDYNYEVSTRTVSGETLYVDTFGAEWRKTGSSTYELVRDHVFKGLYYTQTASGQWNPNEMYWSYTGTLTTKSPGSSGELRVWAETKNLLTWMAIDRFILTIYPLEGSDEEIETYYLLDPEMGVDAGVTNETMYCIPITDGSRAFKIEVSYKSGLFYDPTKLEYYMKTKLMFVLNTEDPVKYTVYFDYMDHGSTLNPIPCQFLKSGSKVTNPGEITEGEYEIVGWYIDSAYTEEWDMENDVIEGDTALYAKWAPIS